MTTPKAKQAKKVTTWCYAPVRLEVAFTYFRGVRGSHGTMNKEDFEYLDRILAKGYRWVRTDGDLAIFELEVV